MKYASIPASTTAADRRAARAEWIADELAQVEAARWADLLAPRGMGSLDTAIEQAVRVLARVGDRRDPLEALWARPAYC